MVGATPLFCLHDHVRQLLRQHGARGALPVHGSTHDLPRAHAAVGATKTISSFAVLTSMGEKASAELCFAPPHHRSKRVRLNPQCFVDFRLAWNTASTPGLPGGAFRQFAGVVVFRFAGASGSTKPSLIISHRMSFDFCPPAQRQAYEVVKKVVPYIPLRAPTRRLPRNLQHSHSFLADKVVANEVKCKVPSTSLRHLSKSEAMSMFGPGDAPSASTYVSRFTACLHVCEAQELEELEQYAIMDAPVTSVGKDPVTGGSTGWFQVPGLLEDRPSVIVGDSICLGTPSAPTAKEKHRVGIVVNVHRDQLCVRLFAPNHAFRAGAVYDVFFMAQRYPILMQHKALQAVQGSAALARLLPPTQGRQLSLQMAVAPQRGQLHRLLNEAQSTALASIVRMASPRRDPFVLFGPPGTGKTYTFVATVLHLVQLQPACKILVVTPSNSAADHFYEQLDAARNNSAAFMRLLSVGELVKREGHTPMQTWNRVNEARVVISTCITAGRLNGHPQGIPPFTHVFVDEAGQATEPETLCALILACPPSTQWILGGDHKQLGPVIRSDLCKDMARFDRSLMERLMGLPAYSASPSFDPNYVVQLVKNYRSHPDFIQVPSALFYMNRLIHAGVNAHASLARWQDLPVPGVPMFAHHTTGQEQREGSNPSWFNISEVSVILQYIHDLLNDSTLVPRVTSDQIIIISPYLGQVRKFQALLRRHSALGDIQVGSVEKFQGREARVVFVSSVRSSMRDEDERNLVAEAGESSIITRASGANLGFLRNPKRFNTCMTRAKELLVLVGNLDVLRYDSCWKAWIDFCMVKGAVKGLPLPSRPQPPAAPPRLPPPPAVFRPQPARSQPPSQPVVLSPITPSSGCSMC